MIQNISTKKLHPHPDNPRKDLGDLTELAESIKAQGILQNLTVVPYIGEVTGEPLEGIYRVIIGHRRLAAAELAGLTEVPCVISNMNHREQVATMLSENIQRSDLTVYEQAQGFQMMMDLGDTTKEIAERTGFSTRTVRRRIKLLELDQKKFKDSEARGATLFDYAELEQIEDLELRNKVLDSIGTSNFKYELQRAIDKEKTEKAIAEAVEKLRMFATKVDNSQGLVFARQYYGSELSNFKIPEDAEETKYFYKVESWGFTLYKEMEEEEEAEDSSATKERELLMERRAALREITERAYNLRCEFVKSISNATSKKNIATIIEYFTLNLLEGWGCNLDYDDIAAFFDIQMPDSDDEDFGFDNIVENLRQQPERYLLLATYDGLDSTSNQYYTWPCTHQKNDALDLVYDFLNVLGYEMSDEEKAMQDGTHELFAVRSVEDD